MANEVKEAKKVTALPRPHKMDNSPNLMLQQGVSQRFPNVTLHFQKDDGEEVQIAILEGKKPGGKYHPDTVVTVLAAVTAMASRTSGSGDGAVVWLADNLNHPRVSRILADDNQIAYEVESSRTGIKGYRWSGATIKAVIQALAPSLVASVEEFGLPIPDTRGKANDTQEDLEVEWDVF